MKLSDADLALLRAGCADPRNAPAQELLNVFGVATPEALLEQMWTAPLSMLRDIAAHFWDAVNQEVIQAAAMNPDSRYQ